MKSLRVAVVVAVGVAISVFFAGCAARKVSVGLFLLSIFSAATLLMCVSIVTMLHFFRKAKPGVTVAAFVRDSRPDEEPDLSAWRWGRLAFASWTVAAGISVVFCVLYALGIRA
jgi:hypothetical protein